MSDEPKEGPATLPASKPLRPLSSANMHRIDNPRTPDRDETPKDALQENQGQIVRRSSRKKKPPGQWWRTLSNENKEQGHSESDPRVANLAGRSTTKETPEESEEHVSQVESKDVSMHIKEFRGSQDQEMSNSRAYEEENDDDHTPEHGLPPTAPRKPMSSGSRRQRVVRENRTHTWIRRDNEDISMRSNASGMSKTSGTTTGSQTNETQGVDQVSTLDTAGGTLTHVSERKLQFQEMNTELGSVELAIALSVNSSYVGILRIPRQTRTSPQRAGSGDEIYYTLSGVLYVDFGSNRYLFNRGDFFSVPHMSSYSFENTFATPAKLLFFAPQNPFG